MVEQSVLNSVREYLGRLEARGFAVSFGVVFGSQLAGNAHQWSDIDLLVVSPHFDEPIKREDINLLWRLAARTDSRIEPVACGERQWQEDTASAVIEIARTKGTRVTSEAASSRI